MYSTSIVLKYSIQYTVWFVVLRTMKIKGLDEDNLYQTKIKTRTIILIKESNHLYTICYIHCSKQCQIHTFRPLALHSLVWWKKVWSGKYISCQLPHLWCSKQGVNFKNTQHWPQRATTVWREHKSSPWCFKCWYRSHTPECHNIYTGCSIYEPCDI